MQQQSAFHFESFQEFISDPQIVHSFILTILLAIGLPIVGYLLLQIYRKMTKVESEYLLPKCGDISLEKSSLCRTAEKSINILVWKNNGSQRKNDLQRRFCKN